MLYRSNILRILYHEDSKFSEDLNKFRLITMRYYRRYQFRDLELVNVSVSIAIEICQKL